MKCRGEKCFALTFFLLYSVNKFVIRRKFFGDYGGYLPKMFIFAKILKYETAISEMTVSKHAKGEI